MNISEVRFYATLRGNSIYPLLKKSLLPLEKDDIPEDKNKFLKNLYGEIRAGRYFPSPPRGYIILDKNRGVPRIIPVFNYRDSCVYYLCVKELEEYIGVNRIEGTYGGWTMGNPIRLQEDAETVPVSQNTKEEDTIPLDFGGY